MKRLGFVEFCKEVVEKIREYFPADFLIEDVALNKIKKNNDIEKTGLIIRRMGVNIAPTIYLEAYYEKYENGMDLDTVLKEIADLRMECGCKHDFDAEKILCFDEVKDRIVPFLIGAEFNREILKNRPHQMIENLAVTYAIMVDSNKFDGMATIAITNQILEGFDISVEKLHKIALKNMEELMPSKVSTMRETLMELMLPDFMKMTGGQEEEARKMAEQMVPMDDSMLILTNKSNVKGATALLDRKIMSQIADRIGDGYFVIPSSIHECIILPYKEDADPEEVKAIIASVNQNEVKEDEVLSFNLYQYTRENGLKIVA